MMQPKGQTPILNVSDIQESFAWFERLGWRKGWDWGDPPDFGCVCAGECEIFLCRDGQGGRGGEHGAWVMIFVDDVDAVYRHCRGSEFDVIMEPGDMPWCVREFHLRHPDGHVFRIGQGIEAQG